MRYSAGAVLSHVTLGSDDIATARRFYDPVLKTLGLVLLHDYPDGLGYGVPGGGAPLWILPPFNRQPMAPGNGNHVALLAPDRAAVDAFHAAALAHGGTCAGPPGLRAYHPSYYAAYVRDPEGNKLQAVNHGDAADNFAG